MKPGVPRWTWRTRHGCDHSAPPAPAARTVLVGVATEYDLEESRLPGPLSPARGTRRQGVCFVNSSRGLFRTFATSVHNLRFALRVL